MLYKLSCWPIIQKVHCHIIKIITFSIVNFLFISVYFNPIGLVSSFPHGTLCTIEYIELLKFRAWLPYIQTILYVDRFTKCTKDHNYNRTFTFYGYAFQHIYILIILCIFFQSRSPLLLESLLIFKTLVNKMFHFSSVCEYNVCFHIRKFS